MLYIRYRDNTLIYKFTFRNFIIEERLSGNLQDTAQMVLCTPA